jgi:hypothetical protein
MQKVRKPHFLGEYACQWTGTQFGDLLETQILSGDPLWRNFHTDPLTAHFVMGIHTHMKQEAYSTAEVAKVIGVSKNTVLRWLMAAKIPEPPRQIFGGVESRIWSAADLARARQFKEEHYRKRS